MGAILPRRLRDGRRRPPSPWGEPPRERAGPERILWGRVGEEDPADAPGSLERGEEVSFDEGIALGVRPQGREPVLPTLVGLEEPHTRLRACDLRRRGRLPIVGLLAGPQGVRDRPISG